MGAKLVEVSNPHISEQCNMMVKNLATCNWYKSLYPSQHFKAFKETVFHVERVKDDNAY